MILTCPECATGYFVKEGQIPSGGRTVRCAACGARWTAYPEQPPIEMTPVDEADAAKTADDTTTDGDAGPLSAEDLPRVFRDRAEEERRTRRAAVMGVVWAGAAVALLLMIGLGILARESVVRAWPPTASLYAAIGLPVNPTGLTIEQVRAEPSLHEGHATLDVSGVIRNVTGREVTAPPLRIVILNAQGKRVAGQIANLDNARIPAGQTRHFMTSIFDPPVSEAGLNVDFVLNAGAGPAATAQTRSLTPPPAPSPGFTLRGAAADNEAPPANATLPPEPAAAPTNAPAGK